MLVLHGIDLKNLSSNLEHSFIRTRAHNGQDCDRQQNCSNRGQRTFKLCFAFGKLPSVLEKEQTSVLAKV